MWFETNVSIPDRDPEVVPRVIHQIEDFVDGVQRIDLLAKDGRGWVKVNALHVERAYSRDEAPILAALVTHCANEHASHRARGGKYRAMIRRHVGPERERRVVTFDVETPLDRRWRERMERIESMPASPFKARMLFIETVIDYNLRMMERLVQQDRIHAQLQRCMLEELTGLLRVYRQGLVMQAQVQGERAQMQVERVLAGMREKNTAVAWDVFAPLIEGVVERVRGAVVGDEAGDGGAVADSPVEESSPGGESFVEWMTQFCERTRWLIENEKPPDAEARRERAEEPSTS